ncbi:hypothetical protein BH09DEP1_BH09DEP1_5560 [soil metagenome]
MKIISMLLLLMLSIAIVGQEKETKTPLPRKQSSSVSIIMPKAPRNSPEDLAIISRTPQRNPSDFLLEPKEKGVCENNCICMECLNRACCELDKIRSKLPYLEAMRNNLKKDNAGQSSGQMVAAVRIMIKVKAISKEGKSCKLLSKKIKEDKKSDKKSGKVEKKDMQAPNQKRNSSSRGPELVTPSDHQEDEEFNQLTNPQEANFKWLVHQAGGDLI